MKRYLVRFTTPTDGGWSTIYPSRHAIVVDESEIGMPFGWQPEEIAGLIVQEIETIQLIHDSSGSPFEDVPFIVSGEYDAQILFDENGLDIPFETDAYEDAYEAINGPRDRSDPDSTEDGESV